MLVAITPYFNPLGYRTRREHHKRFSQALQAQGVHLITIQAAFGDDPFDLPIETPNTWSVRCNTVLWQKERLINLAARWLPAACTGVAWIDGDILFDDPEWAVRTSEALERHALVQCWSTCDRWDAQGKSCGDEVTSCAAVLESNPNAFDNQRYDGHGHTGYAWAIRRSILDEVGLYEYAITGCADHFLVHAASNYWGPCITNALGEDTTLYTCLRAWGEEFYKHVQGNIGVVPGTIRHLWHGDLTQRRYFLRNHDLRNLRFNPYTDIIAAPGAPLEWTPHVRRDKPALVAYFDAYFRHRQEDGPAVLAEAQIETLG